MLQETSTSLSHSCMREIPSWPQVWPQVEHQEHVHDIFNQEVFKLLRLRPDFEV